MQTFWLELDDKCTSSTQHSHSNDNDTDAVNKKVKELEPKRVESAININDRTMRLISWNIEVLQRLLKQIVERRYRMQSRPSKGKMESDRLSSCSIFEQDPGKMVIDEVKEIITLPGFDPTANNATVNIEVDQYAIDQLGEYVTEIASLYRDNPCKLKDGLGRRVVLPLFFSSYLVSVHPFFDFFSIQFTILIMRLMLRCQW